MIVKTGEVNFCKSPKATDNSYPERIVCENHAPKYQNHKKTLRQKK
jgi:hypothetical protein